MGSGIPVSSIVRRRNPLPSAFPRPPRRGQSGPAPFSPKLGRGRKRIPPPPGFWRGTATPPCWSGWGTGGRGVRSSQAAAWTGEFLALERRCDPKRLPEILKNFLRAGAWLGDHPDHQLTLELRDRYPRALIGAAMARSMADRASSS